MDRDSLEVHWKKRFTIGAGINLAWHGPQLWKREKKHVEKTSSIVPEVSRLFVGLLSWRVLGLEGCLLCKCLRVREHPFWPEKTKSGQSWKKGALDSCVEKEFWVFLVWKMILSVYYGIPIVGWSFFMGTDPAGQASTPTSRPGASAGATRWSPMSFSGCVPRCRGKRSMVW